MVAHYSTMIVVIHDVQSAHVILQRQGFKIQISRLLIETQTSRDEENDMKLV